MQLTIKQFAAISLIKSDPPWNLGEILRNYGISQLSIKQKINDLSESRALLYLHVRDVSALQYINSVDELISKWNSFSSNKGVVERLSKILSTIGGSIVSISRDWKIVGVMASFAELTRLVGVDMTLDLLQKIKSSSHIGDVHTLGNSGSGGDSIATGAGILGGVLIGIAVSATAAPAIIVTAAVVGGILVGGATTWFILRGIDQIRNDGKQSLNEFNDVGSDSPPQILGNPPQGVDPNNPAITPIDVNFLGEALAESIGDKIIDSLGDGDIPTPGVPGSSDDDGNSSEGGSVIG